MKLAFEEFPFKLLTDCFCGGADNKKGPAEMRVASIRGQVRFWHRQFADNETVNRVWGATEAPNVGASKVSMVLDRHMTCASQSQLLPHPNPGNPHKEKSSRAAIPRESKFVLTSRRLPGCINDDWKEASDAIKFWLVVGGLGLRCNRAAGSVWPTGDWAPKDESGLHAFINPYRAQLAFRLVDKDDPDTLRKHASDTVLGSPGLFGQALGGRQPSPLKIKVVQLGEVSRLLLVAKKNYPFDKARTALAGHPLSACSWDTI